MHIICVYKYNIYDYVCTYKRWKGDITKETNEKLGVNCETQQQDEHADPISGQYIHCFEH